MHSKVLIIGSGPAGYTAAIYAARAMLEPTLVQGLQPGGQLTITTDVENYPGYGDVIQGPWLMEQMQEQAKNVGTNIINDIIKSVDFKCKPFKAISESGTEYTADSVIISTGAQARWLGLDSEKKFSGKGVSACATCDGFFFREQDVGVVGGGDTAAEEATYLAKLCTKVTMLVRKDYLRASKAMQHRVMATKNLTVLYNHETKRINGEPGPIGVESVTAINNITNKEIIIPASGFFVAIGHKPNTDLFKDQLEMDENGYLKVVPGTASTEVKGVYAAGDVADHVYRQAVTSAGTGCMAALDAERFLSSQET